MACGDSGGPKCAGAWTASIAGVMALSEVFFVCLFVCLFFSLLQLAIRRPLWPVFSVGPAIQAFRGLPFLGSFSVVWHIRHIEGPPWLGSYSVDRVSVT